MTVPDLTPADLPLQRAYRWEKERAQAVFLTQPVGGGVVMDITWEEALSEVRHVADYLVAQHWPAGSRIAILGKNSAHWILADLAIWMAGHVSVPIYPTFNQDALRYILLHSGAVACFVGKLDDATSLLAGVPGFVPLIPLPLSPMVAGVLMPEFTPSIPSGPDQLPGDHGWDAIVANGKPLLDSPVRSGAELATIIYTSGTTGDPKGVMQSFAAMTWALESAMQRVPMDSSDRFISYLPLAHVAERMLIEQGAIHHGCHVFFAETPDTFMQDLQRARPTVFFSVPRLWVKFQQGVHEKVAPAKLQRLLGIPLLGRLVRRKILRSLGLDQCRVAAGGAAPMPADVLQWYRTLGLDLLEVYGMTENCGVSHATVPGSFHPGSVGLPHDGVAQRIDPQTGEIQMRSPAVMLGYYRDEALTAATLTPDGWLRTGDKGHIDADGMLHITGRLKDIFKTSKGKYIAPAPIEDLLVAQPDIEACAVTGAQLDQPLAIVMLSAAAQEQAKTLAGRLALEAALTAHRNAVNARIQGFERLCCLVVSDITWTPENGFVTPTLKVKRGKIDEAYGPQFAEWASRSQAVVWMGNGPRR